MWWNLVQKVGVPVPSFYESVPIEISPLDNVGIPRTNFSFYIADSDTDATVTCSGVVWHCPLVSRGTDVDLLPEFVIFMIAPSPKIGGTNTFNFGGTWYLMSWYRYQRPPSCHPPLENFLLHVIENCDR